MSSKSSSVATVNCRPVWGGASGSWEQGRPFSIFILRAVDTVNHGKTFTIRFQLEHHVMICDPKRGSMWTYCPFAIFFCFKDVKIELYKTIRSRVLISSVQCKVCASCRSVYPPVPTRQQVGIDSGNLYPCPNARQPPIGRRTYTDMSTSYCQNP